MLPILYDIHVAQQRFDSIVVGWKPAASAADIAASTLAIQRSYVQNDGFETIATVSPSTMVYIDTEANKQQKWLSVYYKLVISNSTTSKTYGPFFLEDEQDAIDRQITRSVNRYLQNNGSQPCLIYQQAYGSEVSRCPKCWDPETQHVIYSNCTTCSGTSYVGTIRGYYSPVLTLIDIKPSVATNQVEDTVQAANVTEARMANYPILRPNDIIRELNDGIIWTVTSVTRQIKTKAVISQDPISLRQIKPGDIEFALPVPTTLVPILRRSRARTEKVLIHNSQGQAQFLDIVV